MPIFKKDGQSLEPLEKSTFEKLGLHEPRDIRPLIKSSIAKILPDIMIVSEEFSDWEGSSRSIDLLGVDRDANLVVIELKRTEHAGHAELQAIRYSAMISKLTFDQMVTTYQNYLVKNNSDENAFDNLLSFFNWPEPDEDKFGQEVKIVLMSDDFSDELVASVMWLLDFGLEIRCLRMKPYKYESDVLIDIDTMLPLPETEGFQVKIREKLQKERQYREAKRDYTRYDVSVSGEVYKNLSKRRMILLLIQRTIGDGHSPEEVGNVIGDFTKSKITEKLPGNLDIVNVQDELKKTGGGRDSTREKRFFCEEGEIFLFEDHTYVFTNQWGADAMGAVEALAYKYPKLGIKFEKSKTDE